jgi:hypothetical protein
MVRTSNRGLALVLLLLGAGVACAGTRAESKAPQGAGAASTTAPAPQPQGHASRSGSLPPGSSNGAPTRDRAAGNGTGEPLEGDETELVVNREVVARCPTVRAVRDHVGEFDTDMVWLAVLVAIADCMGEGGAMGGQVIAVSGDEEHRHVVREVLASRGIAPTRVVAPPLSPGAAECQGGADCRKQVIISIAAH